MIFQAFSNTASNARCFETGVSLSLEDPIHIWCSVTYGIFFSAQSSGVHRSLGVGTSFVRSLCLDKWTAAQALAMTLGGNERAAHSLFDDPATYQAFVAGCKSDPASLGKHLKEVYLLPRAAAYRQELATQVKESVEKWNLPLAEEDMWVTAAAAE